MFTSRRNLVLHLYSTFGRGEDIFLMIAFGYQYLHVTLLLPDTAGMNIFEP
jgi:hypothetical protein